uniref:Zebrafish testis-expressed 38 n=1 Tax=Eptatretus burgeri TaxID=7764 RepID=A0A8C4QRU0_EPTBU
MTAIALSNITYLRGIFPEHAYSTRYFEDLSLKILREDNRFAGACHVVNWMRGCFDALEKRFLRMMVLLAYTNPDDPNTIVESYSFKYFYTENGHTMDISSSDKKLEVTLVETKRSTIVLIRKLFVLMQHLGTLPQSIALSMKLFYYDEVTPADYQPPGFKESNSDTILFDGDPVSLRIGSVSTLFHVLKIKVTTDHDKIENIDEDREQSQLMVEDGKKESSISLNIQDPKEDKKTGRQSPLCTPIWTIRMKSEPKYILLTCRWFNPSERSMEPSTCLNSHEDPCHPYAGPRKPF